MKGNLKMVFSSRNPFIFVICTHKKKRCNVIFLSKWGLTEKVESAKTCVTVSIAKAGDGCLFISSIIVSELQSFPLLFKKEIIINQKHQIPGNKNRNRKARFLPG